MQMFHSFVIYIFCPTLKITDQSVLALLAGRQLSIITQVWLKPFFAAPSCQPQSSSHPRLLWKMTEPSSSHDATGQVKATVIWLFLSASLLLLWWGGTGLDSLLKATTILVVFILLLVPFVHMHPLTFLKLLNSLAMLMVHIIILTL